MSHKREIYMNKVWFSQVFYSAYKGTVILTYIAYTDHQEHCINSDSVNQEVLTSQPPLSPVPCLRCGGKCCPQDELFPFICKAPGICTIINPVHYCGSDICSPSIPCDGIYPGCCPVGRICGQNCCPPDSILTRHICLEGFCTEIMVAHHCGSAVCSNHIPCDTTGLGCCPSEKTCGHGETCCPANNATYNFECDPTSQKCIAIERCNDGDNPCSGSKCMDDGYCCPDELACDNICCTPPLVPPGPSTWKCASKPKNLCCSAGDVATDDGICCPVEQVVLLPRYPLPPRIACCIRPERPYQMNCCTQDLKICNAPVG
jgi:hypothetical protein